MTPDIILTRALQLALLTDIRAARRAHRSTRKLQARLVRVTAELAAMEAA